MFKTFFFILLLSICVFAQNKSVYTPISNAKCKTTTTSPVSGFLNCPGAGGYSLEILDDDARMSVNVVAPDQQIYELDFWGFFRRFSSVGERAEWRLKKEKPIGLIIRYEVSKPGDDGKTTSYLMVSKITPTKSCLVGIVNPGKNQNLTAQKLADTAAGKPCKKTE